MNEPFPEALTAALHRWPEVRREIVSLLESANPNAIVSCELNLALLRMDRRTSQGIIERYRAYYRSTIVQYVQPVSLTVREIEDEVRRLLDLGNNKTAAVDRNRSNILELCRELADQLSALDALADLRELNG